MLKWHECSCSSYPFKRQHHSCRQMETLPKKIEEGTKNQEYFGQSHLTHCCSQTVSWKAALLCWSTGVPWVCIPGGWGHCPTDCAANPSSQHPAAQQGMETLWKGEAGEVEKWPGRNELSSWPISHSWGAGHWWCRGKYSCCQQRAKQGLKHLEFQGYICF